MSVRLIILACLLVVVGTVGVVRCAGEKDANGPAEARLATLVTVTAEEDEPVRVPFAFTNPSNGTVSYGWDPDGSGLYNLQGKLSQDGKALTAGRVDSSPAPLDKKQVKELNPGESVVLRYKLPYGKVKAGRYELRLSYEIHPKSTLETKLGLTAMKLEQTLLLDIKRK